MTVLRAAGVQFAAMPTTNAILDAVAGAAAPDGQRPGALVAQPHSPYMKKQMACKEPQSNTVVYEGSPMHIVGAGSR